MSSKKEYETLRLDSEKYPEIFKLYKKDRKEKIMEIFDTGYKIYHPEVTTTTSIEYHQILQSIDDLKKSNKDDKFDELVQCINKLIGLSNNSAKKGELAENVLEELFSKRYGDIKYEDKSKVAHCGDAWLYLHNNKRIMLESKNYSHKVNNDELVKMENDMKTNNIFFGIFISWNSSIVNKKDFDIHVFNHNGKNYISIIVCKLSENIEKLDLSLQLVRRMMELFDNDREFPWIVENIKDDLSRLDTIIKKNNKLRDDFENMSSIIRDSMGIYYDNLRKYQFEINVEIDNIINKINSTMKESINVDSLVKKDSLKILKEFKKEKMFVQLGSIMEVLDAKKCKFTNEDKNIIIHHKKNKIGIIKLQKKKIYLVFEKYGLTFDIDKDTDLKSITKVIKSII